MSNRKKRRRATPKLPRDDYVYGSTADVVSTLTFTVNSVTGAASIAGVDPSTITRRLTHKRAGKDDKVIYSAPADDFSLSLGHFDELKRRFDYLIAVDTNTRKKPEVQEGYAVSASCIYYISEPIQTVTSQIQYQHLASYIILDTNIHAKHEPLGWHLAIIRHVAHPVLRTSRIGIIVDSELGKHLEINARKIAYYAGHYLPENVTLLYASGERTDTFANGMIKHCDAGANAMLDEMERRGLDELVQKDAPIDGTAKWFSISGIHSIPGPDRIAPDY